MSIFGDVFSDAINNIFGQNNSQKGVINNQSVKKSFNSRNSNNVIGSNINSNNVSKTFINNSDRPTSFVKLTCDRCGGQIELDFDNLQATCPYCGEKLMLDTSQIAAIISEREETKRHQMDIDQIKWEKEQQRQDDKSLTPWLLLLIFIPLIGLILLSSVFSSGERKYNRQEKHLESIVKEIQVDINNKDYISATLKASQLHFSPTGWDNDRDVALVKKWDSIREETIKMIEEARKREYGTDTTKTAVIFKGGGLIF